MTMTAEHDSSSADMPGADKTARWYSKEINENLKPAARELLENYSKIPAEEVEKHVYTVRDKAWNIQPYPCIGQFRFLDLSISLSPHYPAILSRLRTGHETYLDLGCCFGQDIRKLVYDGVPSQKLYGCDLRPEYFDCGYELFRDRETLKSTFFQADVFNPDSDLAILDGKIDVCYIGSFLHLFAYSQQVEICVRISELLRDREGSVVLGRQMGDAKAGEFKRLVNFGGGKNETIMRHDVESFRKMWDEVGSLTGTKWRVDAELIEGDPAMMVGSQEMLRAEGGQPASPRRLVFAVFRQPFAEME